MEQEKIEKILPEVQEDELKEEKFKKIFIIFAVLLLFGGTCYYYAGTSKLSQKKLINSSLKATQAEIASETKALKQIQNNITAPYRKRRLEQLEKIQKAEKNPEIKLVEAAIPEKTTNITKAKIKPMGKSVLLSLANKSSGKHDPFSYSESQYTPFTSNLGSLQDNSSLSPSQGLPGNLPPVPGAGNIGNLPAIPGLSGSILPGGLNSSKLANPPAPRPEDLITIKGFIGNKVIAEVNGMIEALNPNESIDNVKVLTVNPLLLTAKFEVNGKTITKTMKNINDENKENIELVKNLHN